ncbi:hypothetical protein BYT27DRAFT_7224612 [Phlegmacium glaucopus]|nr:hypothetical protein BYT27DRAFT_7224612 [Phlegmacium glaucopus]
MHAEPPWPLSPPPPPPPPPRLTQIPRRYVDLLPEAVPIQHGEQLPQLPRVRLYMRDRLCTAANAFGMWYLRIAHSTTIGSESEDSNSEDSDEPELSVHANKTTELIMEWANTGSPTKSNAEVNRLVHKYIRHPDFKPADLQSFDANSFQKTTVNIEVPMGIKDAPPHIFLVPGLYYRQLTASIRAAFSSPIAAHFHYSPFKQFRTSPITGEPEQIFSEVYDSDAFIEEHDKIQRSAPTDDPDCKLEKVVAAIMFWSDSTHLANFGTAKLWPPHSGAYIIDNVMKGVHASWKTQKRNIITHCRRELMHTIWKFLLDEDFLHAYKYGMVIKCADGVEHHVYPRIFTYSADYPEKVLLATIHDQGLCPCPRCLMPKALFDRMGLKPDMAFHLNHVQTFLSGLVASARNAIYKHARSIGGSVIDRILKLTSSVPTMNAFVDRLGDDFDLSRMLVVDLMHKFELGVWKLFFTHLICILYAAAPDGSLVEVLNERYCQMPTFGLSTICKFSNNASEMKKLAARDFEDLLQCAVPSTLSYLETLTRELGQLMRQFRDETCSHFETFELPREAEARNRQQQSKAQGKQPEAGSGGRKLKLLNLFIYKWHSLGDYVQTICLFGGTDGFSTQLGELAHRLVKRLYGQTNKREAVGQIAKRWRRLDKAQRAYQCRLHREHKLGFTISPAPAKNKGTIGFQEDGDPELWYHISGSKNKTVNVSDPAYKLQDHLLDRLIDRSFDGDTHEEFSDVDRNSVCIVGNKIYTIKTCQLYYTTYDLQRKYDTVNPTSHPDVMVRSPKAGTDASPYWYARVLSMYYANVWTTNPAVKDGDISSDDYAFGFLDPRHVVHGCHLIPAFQGGRTSKLLPMGNSAARMLEGAMVDDWANFYVNVFADCDLLMQHFGGGVGHVNNTVEPSVDLLSDMDVDSEEEAAVGPTSALDSDLSQDNTAMRAEIDPEEMDEEMAEAECNEDPNKDEELDEYDELADDEEAQGASDDNGYASL